MNKYLRYANYVLAHKWRILKLAPFWGVPLWQAIIHDWTRFLPQELIPSAEYFYGHYNTAAQGYRWTRGEYPAYDQARDLHETRNPHHERYWNGQPIPERYIREMLCDWDAAGQKKGRPIGEWYAEYSHTLNLHPETRARVEQLLSELAPPADGHPPSLAPHSAEPSKRSGTAD